MNTYYESPTGKILGVIYADTPESLSGWLIENPTIRLIPGVFSTDQYYIAEFTACPRPIINTDVSKNVLSADGIDSVVISSLPWPCTVTVDNISYSVQDSIFEFTTNLPGTYKVRVEAFPYLPKEWEVTAI